MIKKCKYCRSNIEQGHICDTCKLERKREKQELKFKEKQEKVEFVRCKICGWPEKRIAEHIKKIHNLTRKEYFEKYNDALITCKSTKQKQAFKGSHSEETKQKMSLAKKDFKPWNTNLKKHQHKSLRDIAVKAKLRTNKQKVNKLLPIKKDDISKLIEEDRVKLAIDIFCELRYIGFLKLKCKEEELLRDYNSVVKSTVKYENNSVTITNNSGSKIREHFISESYIKLKELFDRDETLIKTIRNRLGLDRKKPEFFNINYKNILKSFELLYPAYKFSKYRPSLAKWIIEEFCNGQVVYDYSAGWGARMLGASVTNRQYIAVDTNNKLIEELTELLNWLLRNNLKTDISINNIDASKFKPEKIDLAYSCPPYGLQEKYSNMNYVSEIHWFESYMKPVIKNCFEGLNNGGKFVCHLPVRLIYDVKRELDKLFNEVQTIDVISPYSPFNINKKKSRINEAILVYEKTT